MRRWIAICIAVFLCGCVTSPDFNFAGLRNVARLSGQQKEVNRYCKMQGQGFRRLEADVGCGVMRAGMSLKSIRAMYGEPAAVVPFQDEHPEMLVYRRPWDFFALPVIYLNLDREGNLSSWSVLEN